MEKAGRLLISLSDAIQTLESQAEKAGSIDNVVRRAEYYRDFVIPAMSNLRSVADELETVVDAEYWPLPSYAEMLFLK